MYPYRWYVIQVPDQFANIYLPSFFFFVSFFFLNRFFSPFFFLNRSTSNLPKPIFLYITRIYPFLHSCLWPPGLQCARWHSLLQYCTVRQPMHFLNVCPLGCCWFSFKFVQHFKIFNSILVSFICWFCPPFACEFIWLVNTLAFNVQNC